MKQLYQWIDRAWQWVAERFFVRFEFDLPLDALRPLAAQRRLAFCLANGGIIEWLILSSWCRKQGFGAILVANRKRVLWLSKPALFFKALFRTRRYSQMFLSEEKGPRLLFCPAHERKQPFNPTFSEQLLAQIYSTLGPSPASGQFHFCPVLVVWRKYARGAARRPIEYLLGVSSNPNLLGKLWYLIRPRKESTVRGLAPFPLREPGEGVDPFGEGEAQRVAKETRRKILVQVQQEMRVLLGSRYHSPHSVKETLLRDPELQQAISDAAAAEGVDRRKIMQRAYRNLTEIVSNYQYRTIEIMYVFLTWLFTKVFDRVQYDPAELQKVREVMKSKPIVFVPCHRSHFDYLVLPYILFLEDMVTPHIAAGINLSFWPIGPFLRTGGAFFIRRSFKGDVLYSLCLKKYIEYLLKNRTNFVFFIEGTRSRTGKMLPPAYGLLKMILERYQHRIVDDVAFFPLSITYDRVPEEGAYTRELGGGQKEKESAASLLKSRKIVRHRMGRVYVKFADPIFARDVAPKAESGPEATLALQKTAFLISKSINDATPITPKSLVCHALLSHRERALPLDSLLRITEELASYAEWSGSTLSIPEDASLKRTMEQTVRQLAKGGFLQATDSSEGRRYGCEPAKRPVLNYYKNNSLHCLVTPSILLLALAQSLKRPPAGHDAARRSLLDDALAIRNVLKFEFFFNPSAQFEDEMDRNAEKIIGETAYRQGGTTEWVHALGKRYGDTEDLSAFACGASYLFQAYLTALEALRETSDPVLDRKAFAQRAIKLASQSMESRELAFPESASSLTYGNALQLFENMKLVAPVEGDRTKVKRLTWGEEAERLKGLLTELLDASLKMKWDPEIWAAAGRVGSELPEARAVSSAEGGGVAP